MCVKFQNETIFFFKVESHNEAYINNNNTSII